MKSGKSKQPLVSVLITVYNGMPFLKEAIQGIQQQTYKHWELIVVDDQSTDASLSYLRLIDDERITILENGKMGRGKALNYGLKHCRGVYVAINDADDFSYPRRIEKQVHFLNSNPDYGLVGSNFTKLFSNGVKVDSHKSLHNQSLRIELSKHSCVQHSTVLFRKSVLDEIGGYNTRIKYLFDRDIYIRVAEVSKIANLPEHLVVINRHDNQFFLHTYKGFERQLHTLKVNFLAIAKLNLPKYLYISRTLTFVYSILSNYFRQATQLWKK
ncbi:MAG: glycosyltransferase family 2 protein [Saprospiraceae bacterium]|nr:glycosyltransferase family 2 protein [Saprospiraceae bacterium]